MNRIAAATAALLATTAIAQADISRTDQSVRVLFEEVGPSGNYVELSFGSVNPTANTALLPNPLADYTLPGFAFLHRVSDNLSFAVIYDQPFGAEVAYPGFGAGAPVGMNPIPPGAPFFGGNATVETQALTVTGRYEFGNGFSVYGGVRAMEVSGSIFTNVTATPEFHLLDAPGDYGFGYLIGAAYERPDIALRVALTYHSAINVDLGANETAINPLSGLPIGPTASTTFAVEFPESINLEFQTGIAENTLLFGSIRHAFWDGFDLSTAVGQYVNFTSDSTTYTLGVGRRFTENFSASLAYTHRTPGTRPSDTALAPTTGLDTITLAGRYEQGPMTISGGVTYGMPGDQLVENIFVPGGISFEDNEVVGVGVRVGFRF